MLNFWSRWCVCVAVCMLQCNKTINATNLLSFAILKIYVVAQRKKLLHSVQQCSGSGTYGMRVCVVCVCILVGIEEIASRDAREKFSRHKPQRYTHTTWHLGSISPNLSTFRRQQPRLCWIISWNRMFKNVYKRLARLLINFVCLSSKWILNHAFWIMEISINSAKKSQAHTVRSRARQCEE